MANERIRLLHHRRRSRFGQPQDHQNHRYRRYEDFITKCRKREAIDAFAKDLKAIENLVKELKRKGVSA
ncbi:MAG: hypothetical protein EA399_06660 [Desulfovibrionales bacterium]|nr:MAG: hypothetical protein EA399_06660 [Desulfovibrionales bacterium]